MLRVHQQVIGHLVRGPRPEVTVRTLQQEHAEGEGTQINDCSEEPSRATPAGQTESLQHKLPVSLTMEEGVCAETPPGLSAAARGD